jgi:hypothetical protein
MIMKKILITLLILIGVKSYGQINAEFHGLAGINFVSGSPEIGLSLDLKDKLYVLESSVVSNTNKQTPLFIQEKIGVHVKKWSFLTGYSYHVHPDYSDGYQYPNKWKFITEIKHIAYFHHMAFGYDLQHDGRFVSLGLIIGTRL